MRFTPPWRCGGGRDRVEIPLFGLRPGASDLPQRLTDGGFAYVLIVGTVTNVCCESSARDAMMLNFKTVMVSDGNSAHSDGEHTATLAAFYAVFGDVMDTDMVIACLRKNAVRVAVAAG